MKKTFIKLVTYNEHYERNEEILKFYGDVSVVVGNDGIDIIEHDNKNRQTKIPHEKYTIFSIRNWCE